ncbi:MAG: VCBS repeat-containing protein [Planctomycetota bacterium]
MRLPALPLLLAAAPASAQFGSFDEIGPTLRSARDVQVVDFDLDGVPDLLAPDLAARRVLMYRGLGGGAFAGAERLADGLAATGDRGPTFLAAGDLDGDGDPDLVTLSEDGETVLLENHGGSAIGPPVFLDAVPVARDSFSLSVGLRDVDADGLLDVVASTGGPSDPASGGTFVQLNLGGLSFAPRVDLTAAPEPGGVVRFGDLDGDGDEDTLVNHVNTPRIYWVRNDGALPRTQVTTIATFGTLLDAELGDVDNDGDLDVLAVGVTSNRVYLFENDGSGGFSGAMVAVPGSTSIGDLELADVDADGDLDLIWARTPGTRRLQWSQNLGGGTFGPVRNIELGTGYWRIQVADLDQDGVLDIVAQNPQRSFWFKGSLAGTVPSFGDAMDIDVPASTAASFVSLVDMDVDGDLDIVGDQLITSAFSFMENDGRGNFQPPVFEFAFNSDFADVIRHADLDGDGDPDLATVPRSSGFVRWYENLGDFKLGDGVVIQATGFREEDLQFADMDGDGDQDAVVLGTDAGVGKLSWAANPGDGSFGVATAIEDFPEGAGTLEIADMDLDGFLDIVLTDSESLARVRLVRGLGAGAFAPSTTVLPPTSARVQGEFVLLDVDRDGLLDVVQMRGQPLVNRVDWVRNAGGGAFVAAVTTLGAFDLEYERLHVADLDADGDTDILASLGSFIDGVRWLENTGSTGIWPSRFLDTPSTAVRGADIGDVDCDGDLDVVVGPDFGNIGVFENLSLGPIGDMAPCGPAVPNSTGVPGALTLAGDADVARNRVTLRAHDLPQNATGFFLTSQMSGSTFPVSGSVGRLCLMGSIGRFVGPGQVLNSGAAGAFCLPIDLTALPQPTGSVQATAGSTWFFQAWHRDVAGGGAVSNFTTSAGVTFQ